MSRRPRVLNKAAQKFYPKWRTFHMEKWVGEELEMEATQELVVKRFEQFKETGLPGIVASLKELRTLGTALAEADA